MFRLSVSASFTIICILTLHTQIFDRISCNFMLSYIPLTEGSGTTQECSFEVITKIELKNVTNTSVNTGTIFS